MSESGYRTIIKELPAQERPRERLALYGADRLSNAELLAIALRTGTRQENALALATRLLAHVGGLVGLAQASVQVLCEVPGIGPAKAAQVLAAVETGRRMMAIGSEDRPQITAPEQAAAILTARLALLPQEELHVMLLDTKHHVMRIVAVNRGNVNAAIVRPAEVFREAVRDGATAIIMAHNHPSGDPTPSPEDVDVTRDVVQAGRLLDIELLDHLIIGRGDWVSMRSKRLGFD